ncbi:hypothetical protein CN469_02640 [Bacillus cereus]|nr:hypothetical protein CN469_02640 [Bacillus cereus]
MVHPISKRSIHENFKIHSPYYWMDCIIINLVCDILSLTHNLICTVCVSFIALFISNNIYLYGL